MGIVETLSVVFYEIIGPRKKDRKTVATASH